MACKSCWKTLGTSHHGWYSSIKEHHSVKSTQCSILKLQTLYCYEIVIHFPSQKFCCFNKQAHSHKFVYDDARQTEVFLSCFQQLYGRDIRQDSLKSFSRFFMKTSSWNQKFEHDRTLTFQNFCHALPNLTFLTLIHNLAEIWKAHVSQFSFHFPVMLILWFS